jgi:hypothetical protein
MLDTATLNLLRASLDRYGRERYTFDQRRAVLGTDPNYSRTAWKDYADMGWLAMPLPADDGGFDSAPQAIGALMEYAGASLALEPLLASVVLCGRALAVCGDLPASHERLQALATGSAIGAFAHAEGLHDGLASAFFLPPVGAGSIESSPPLQTQARAGRITGTKPMVLHGDVADFLVVSASADEGAIALYLVDCNQAGVERARLQGVDGRGSARLQLRDAQAQQLVAGEAATRLLRELEEHARLALCAESLGAIRALNALTLDYLKERRQFGRPIGSNQALQHRMVELYMVQEEGRAVLGAAQRAPVGDERRTATLAAAAHFHAAGRLAAHEAVQMHGGIGVTEELAVSHYFRRILSINRLLGDRDLLVREYAAP